MKKSAKPAVAAAAPVPAEFPVSLEEFLAELPSHSVGAGGAFRHAARELAGKRLRPQWQKLFDKFMQAPVGTKITG